ncbi:hypothetical protein Tco_1004341 [Tanacetum coccineum]|uniref:CCHC-type domain-containing protein n=1 Tax=Tanacetum coccineum TaxID=301880 RepID=A0ABQ5FCD5_9ASTR
MSWFSRCSWCGGPFNGGNCRHCTNVSFGDEPVYDFNQTPDFSNPPSQPLTSSSNQWHCGYALSEGFCSFCPSRDENSSIDDPNPNSFNDLPNDFTHPPQLQYESYSCKLCGNDSHYGYDCPPQFLLCQPMNQNNFEPNPSYSSFDQPPQYSINPQPPNIQENPNWKKINELIQMMQSSCEKLLQQEQAASITQSPFQEMSIQDMEDLKQHYLDEMLSLSNQIKIKDYQNEKIDIHFRRECESMIDELNGKFNGISIEINKKKELQHLE